MTDSRPNSKVARVIEEYDLSGMGEQLEVAWTGEYGERTSLRDLADEFNRAVLEAAIRDADGPIAETDLESLYRTLTDDDVSGADRMRKRRELESTGVDVERVESDFVTHQAVHTYLTEYRDAELPDRSEDVAERKAELLERLQGRTVAVANSTVDRLVENGDITDRSYDVVVDVRVVCGDCGSDYSAGELFRQGGCDCAGP
ncbi:rod-determining factor RdfA [Halobaculum sp. EA56]|uniref:rod-determining factor RdfA n=1 Tax=Halobaculum sp. EA56 TaxID=3421648 RepID=UPI003EB7D21A